MKNQLAGLQYWHVDVFSKTPLSGNGLTVFLNSDRLSTESMQRLTQEMRQFESIFLVQTEQPEVWKARIFTMEEELDFAGHPVLGAACILHHQRILLHQKSSVDEAVWQLQLNAKTVQVKTVCNVSWYRATMNQGCSIFSEPLSNQLQSSFLRALSLSEADLADYPLQVVSNGLPYLIMPICQGLERANIVHPNFEALLRTVGAKFVYVLDVESSEGRTSEGRTWDNAGLVEDVATGSAAGPVGAYLVRHKLREINEPIALRQGRFVGRPSQIEVKVEGESITGDRITGDRITTVQVSGDVCILAKGVFY